MKFIEKAFFLLALWGLTWAGWAAVLTPTSTQLNLVSDAQFLEDPTGTWRLEDVQARDAHFEHWRYAGEALNFGFTASAYWIRVPLHRSADARADWVLEIPYAKLEQLDVYLPQGTVAHTGSSRPLASRPVFNRFFVFPLDVGTGPAYLYLRASSAYALTVPLTLWSQQAFSLHQTRSDMLQFMYFGGLLILMLYGAVIFVALRDQRFGVFACYALFMALAMFASNGYGRLLLWPAAPAFDEISQALFFSLSAFFAALLAQKILNLDAQFWWLDGSLRLSQWAFVLLSGLSLLGTSMTAWRSVTNQGLLLNGVALGFLVTLACLQAHREKKQGLRFFISGWLVLWLGVSVATLRAFDLLPTNAFTAYAVQIATVFEMVLMAMALADQLLLDVKARQAAQAQALAAQKQMLLMSRNSEEKLQLAVQQRTTQLAASLQVEKNLREKYVRFGSLIAHEFRTPLGVIQTQASLLRKEHERGVDHVGQRLEALQSAAKRLRVMFDKWLNSDVITQSLDALAPKPLQIRPWLQTWLDSQKHLLLRHQVAWQLDPKVVRVEADAYHLGIALGNLLDNACKYSPAETVVTVGTRSKPGFVGLSVQDQGPGIAPDVQEGVFSDFFRLHADSHIPGVGLGLSIVRRIADAHGGHVTLDSSAGMGATFCIWLPVPVSKD